MKPTFVHVNASTQQHGTGVVLPGGTVYFGHSPQAWWVKGMGLYMLLYLIGVVGLDALLVFQVDQTHFIAGFKTVIRTAFLVFLSGPFGHDHAQPSGLQTWWGWPIGV